MAKAFGVFGVYCWQCSDGNVRVKFMTGELKRLIDTIGYKWLEDVVPTFTFTEFRKGLEWFAAHQCLSYHNIKQPNCRNIPCVKEHNLESCLLCDDYLTCEHTTYLRDRYPFVIDNYQRVQQVGFPQHLDEKEERARSSATLHGHLERQCCKVIDINVG